MRLTLSSVLLALIAANLSACGGSDAPAASSQAEQGAAEQSAAEPEQAAALPPYQPVATMAELMRGPITFAAEDYWASVSIVVDADGIHENVPQTDDEWLEVWSAGIALAELGSLLMIPPRALEVDAWMRMSEALVDAGVLAAQAAEAQDYEAVLDAGEVVYNSCLDCHRRFVPRMSDL